MMSKRIHRALSHARQDGAVLVVALLLLLVLTIIGVTVAGLQTGEERMARNDQNHELAVESAEAALRMAESGLLNGTYTSFTQDAGGLFQLDPTVGNWPWNPAQTLAYAGPAMPTAQQPQIMIEQLPPVAGAGDDTGNCGYGCTSVPIQVFRITAYSPGGDTTSGAQLQSIYRD
jgi:type IV pilus assembly protein PilX